MARAVRLSSVTLLHPIAHRLEPFGNIFTPFNSSGTRGQFVLKFLAKIEEVLWDRAS